MLESHAFSGCIACEKFVFYCKQTFFKCVMDATLLENFIQIVARA